MGQATDLAGQAQLSGVGAGSCQRQLHAAAAAAALVLAAAAACKGAAGAGGKAAPRRLSRARHVTLGRGEVSKW